MMDFGCPKSKERRGHLFVIVAGYVQQCDCGCDTISQTWQSNLSSKEWCYCKGTFSVLEKTRRRKGIVFSSGCVFPNWQICLRLWHPFVFGDQSSHTFLSHTTYWPSLPGSPNSGHPLVLPHLHHPLSARLHVTLTAVAFLVSACPLTLSTFSHRLPVNLPINFFLKPISWSALSPFQPPHSTCLLVFNFESDYFGELTSTGSLPVHLHPSPSSSP